MSEVDAMVLQTKILTMEEFREFVNQEENSDKLFELINGEIIEVPTGRTSNSRIGLLIVVAVVDFAPNMKFPATWAVKQAHTIFWEMPSRRILRSNERPWVTIIPTLSRQNGLSKFPRS